MNIDDPIKAAESLIASDKRQGSPVTELIADTLAALEIPGAGSLTTFLDKRRAENRNLLINVLRNELQTLIRRFDELSAEHQRFIQTGFVELLADGLRKAENVRDRERVIRIAKILASAGEGGPAFSADETEEMMRIAVDLSNADVTVLGALLSRTDNPITRNPPAGRTAPVPFGTYRGPSREPPIEVKGLSAEAIQSCCLKLQSFGLVLIDTETRWGEHRAFNLLPRGRDFIRYLKEVAVT